MSIGNGSLKIKLVKSETQSILCEDCGFESDQIFMVNHRKQKPSHVMVIYNKDIEAVEGSNYYDNPPKDEYEIIENKIPLSEFKDLSFDGGPRFFRTTEVKPELMCKIRLTTSTSGFKTDYQKDELVPTNFVLVGQSDTKQGVEIRVTEEMLEKMLNYIREEKQKVYCFEGSV